MEVDAARAEVYVARPDEGFCHAAPSLSLLRLLHPTQTQSLSVQGQKRRHGQTDKATRATVGRKQRALRRRGRG
jgi:hypothetical protein